MRWTRNIFYSIGKPRKLINNNNRTTFLQDEAAGLVVRMLDPQPGESVLDCCAAPGGKALFAATLMMGKVTPHSHTPHATLNPFRGWHGRL